MNRKQYHSHVVRGSNNTSVRDPDCSPGASPGSSYSSSSESELSHSSTSSTDGYRSTAVFREEIDDALTVANEWSAHLQRDWDHHALEHVFPRVPSTDLHKCVTRSSTLQEREEEAQWLVIAAVTGRWRRDAQRAREPPVLHRMLERTVCHLAVQCLVAVAPSQSLPNHSSY